ncbi:MAG: ribosomal RNA small subunit methyltransferase A [Candidatus Magasanikbacteria bacterium]|nr:ribosomal RNA small subunit methyltransferase A [Candidatus Magasanikbacteria bacterium]
MLDITKPSVLQELCKQYRLTPSKGYGQNFLITDAPIKKMIEAAELKASDIVVEIGPGFGVLTFALAERVKKVIAFEIERKLAGYWSDLEIRGDREINRDKIEIVWGNALNKIQDTSNKIQKYKVIANLPYQITSDVLRTLLELENKPELIVIMVQKEVAERICAQPPSARHTRSGQAGNMSLLSVAVQYYGEPKIIAKVPAGSFWPRPKVESAIVRITLSRDHCITTSLHHDDEREREFFRVVRAGFAQKRKQLWNNLAKGLKLDGGKVKAVLREVVGNEKVRAEEVSVEEWRVIVGKLESF